MTFRASQTFSRAFAWFAETALADRMHSALIEGAFEETVVGHLSRDSAAIESREKSKAKVSKPKTTRRRGCPRKGETRPKELRRLDRPLNSVLLLKQMLADLPTACDMGTKRHAKSDKCHLDVSDGDIPISGVLTAASLHDSQASLQLATMTSRRGDDCYELMDAAYDGSEIHSYAEDMSPLRIPIPAVIGRESSSWSIRLIRRRNTTNSVRVSNGSTGVKEIHPPQSLSNRRHFCRRRTVQAMKIEGVSVVDAKIGSGSV